MPSWWVGGNPNAMFQNNLAANQAAMNNSTALVNSWQHTPEVSQAQLYGPGGFGAMTDHYSALAAAYGRATGGFGKMPSGADAPAGRVGTISNPGGGGEAAPTPVSVDSSPFGVENAGPVPYLDSGGSPFGGGGFGRMPTIFDTGATGIDMSGAASPFGGGGFGGRGPSPNPTLSPLASYGGTGYDAFDPSIYAGSTGFGVPGFGARGRAGAMGPALPSPNPVDQGFKQFGMYGTQMENQPAIDAVQAFNGVGTDQYPHPMPSFRGRDVAFAGQPPFQDYDGAGAKGSFSPSPNNYPGGVNPLFRAMFGTDAGGASPFDFAHGEVAGGEGSFAQRFADGKYYQPGQPSQYATSPYTRHDGQTFQPGPLPPGFSPEFGVDQPNGALPVGGFRNLPKPQVMGAGGEGDSADTLTAHDASIPFGPGGGFDPSAFDPRQFAPGSPFGSGRGVGGWTSGSAAPGGGIGTIKPETSFPIPHPVGGGFEDLGSLQQTGQHGFPGRLPALVGSPVDEYGNPFIHGSAPPFATDTGTFGGGRGIGGLSGIRI